MKMILKETIIGDISIENHVCKIKIWEVAWIAQGRVREEHTLGLWDIRSKVENVDPLEFLLIIASSVQIDLILPELFEGVNLLSSLLQPKLRCIRI